MVEAYDDTLPYRIALAIIFFGTLAARDWIQNPRNPTRVREYGFLLIVMCVVILYGVIHDHITATISPEYFLEAKQIGRDNRPFRWAVTLLATKASYGPGLLVGALMLIANNPSPEKMQLRYPHLLRLCGYPVSFAAGIAFVFGSLSWLIAPQTSLHGFARQFVGEADVERFLCVWGIHMGSYVGAATGTVVAVVNIARIRPNISRTHVQSEEIEESHDLR